MTDDTFERLKAALASRYQLDRLIGQGGMATVYLARDHKHGRQVAIKILRPDLAATLGPERFLLEIELAARLQHPHILPVYDSGQADGTLYYVMPYVEGESLRELLRREQKLPLERAVEIIRAVASGLAHAHAQGVVHRDVKPENIMLSGGLAVVTDFGIARAVNASRQVDTALTGVGMAVGTPAYMSPEQATADEVDGRADQYALACVFYEMLSGNQPFTGPTLQALLTSMLTAPRPRLVAPGVTPGVDAATQRALATNPSERFETITGFAEAVARESSGTVAATRESRRWKRLAIALPLLVALVAATIYGVRGREPLSSVVSGAETIAVVPFSVSGPGAEGLGEGMVDLLTVNLNGVGSIRTVDARVVLREWRRRVKEHEAGTLEEAIAVARASRAASVLMGSIISTGGSTRMTADLYDLTGRQLAHAQVTGAGDAVLRLTDSLAVQLVREIWQSRQPIPSASSGLITSTSMPAIKAYLRGEAFHRRGNWDSAQVAFETAVEADSTFAVAWYRLANTLGWKGQYQSIPMRMAAEQAERHSIGFPARLRSLMVAYNLFAHGDVHATDSAVVYTREYPNDLDGWFLLGESQFHTAAYHPLAPEALRSPFDRVLALDSSLTSAAIHPIELAMAEGNTALVQRYLHVLRAGGDSAGVIRTETALAFLGGQDSLAALLAQPVPLLPSLLVRAYTGRVSRSRMTGDSLAAFAEALGASNYPEVLQPQFRVLGAGLLLGVGRQAAARAHLGALAPPGSDLASYPEIFPVMAGIAQPTQLAAVDTMLGRLLAQHAGSTDQAIQMSLAIQTYLRALIALDRGDAARAGELARAAQVMPYAPGAGWFQGAAQALDGLALAASGDTLRGMARADSGLRRLGEGGNRSAVTISAQLRVARFEAARPSTWATGVARFRQVTSTEPQLGAINALQLARIFERAAMPDSAAVQYRAFLQRFDRADEIFQPLVREAQEALQRLQGDRQPTAPIGGGGS